MFTVAELDASLTPVLSDQSTDRYDFDLFRMPAYKAAFRRLIALLYPFVAQRKNVEENLSELLVTRVFETNILGGVSFPESQLGHKVWTINAVYAEQRTYPPSQPIFMPLPAASSAWVNNRTLVPGAKPVKRMTTEQANMAYGNKSMAGSEAAADSPWVDYGYYLIGDRSHRNIPISDSWLPPSWEILMTPASLFNKKYVGVSYYRMPADIVDTDSVIELPATMMVLIRDLALNELSVRQGNRSTLYQVTSQQVGELLMAQT